ncbi:MAG: hypothetical protein QF682_03630 [Candidatus Thermoplasmatota archaeon]|nr:hypothetical protein [Candidatus Thermoplasmatota archaeon]
MKGNISILNISGAFEKYYWSEIDEKVISKHVVSEPLIDLIDHIDKAINAGLEKRGECAYSGSVLLSLVLEGTGRKYSYNIDETNDLYKEGKALAGDVWDALVDGLSLVRIKKQVIGSLWNDYLRRNQKKRSGE